MGQGYGAGVGRQEAVVGLYGVLWGATGPYGAGCGVLWGRLWGPVGPYGAFGVPLSPCEVSMGPYGSLWGALGPYGAGYGALWVSTGL